MKQNQSNLYEGMFVLSAVLSDELRRKLIDKIKSTIEERGGEFVKIHDQGRKRLAYEIEKQKEGYYLLMYFNFNPALITQIWREFRLTEGILRFMTLRATHVMEKIEFKQLVEQ